MQLAFVILMVTGVHFVEAYGLNPAIYSAHLKLHPLLVLTGGWAGRGGRVGGRAGGWVGRRVGGRAVVWLAAGGQVGRGEGWARLAPPPPHPQPTLARSPTHTPTRSTPLAVLVVAEHSLGVWGLLLAVPLTVFALDYLVSTCRLRAACVCVRVCVCLRECAEGCVWVPV